ncbi:hypothetical protein PINS_up006456 [Pythium insidiosum]|nr:hypothetical protein PINS_up006456 [Pythium insidiosum]
MMASQKTTRLRRLRHILDRAWVSAQVELHGRYSLQNFQDLDDYYSRTPWWRAAIVCLLTPLPAIIVVLLIDLLPLDPISYGPHSPPLWVRTYITIALISVAILEQFRQHVTELRLTRRSIWVISLVTPGVSVSCTYGMTLLVGYPLPFAMLVGTIPWLIMLVALLLVFYRQQLRTNRRLVKDLINYHVVFGCQVLMTIVYPIYSFLYSRLTSIEQTLTIFLLPILKIAIKNCIGRWLPDTDDARPEAVVFNIEIFHALFVAFTMQKTTSVFTILALMAVDCVHAWLTFLDITIALRRVGIITAKLERRASVTSPSPRPRQASHHRELRWLLQVAIQVTAEAPELVAQRTQRGLSSPSKHSSLANSNHSMFNTTKVVPIGLSAHSSKHSISGIVGPSKIALPSNLGALTVDEKRTLVQTVLKVLYISEFLALIEYTEVIMPMIFSTYPRLNGLSVCPRLPNSAFRSTRLTTDTYLVALFHMPNRAYYPFLDGVDLPALRSTVGTITLYVLLELGSFIMMAIVLWWKLRLSLVHQLAFVLETRQVNIQAKLLLWVLDIIQNAIIQFGTWATNVGMLHQSASESNDCMHRRGLLVPVRVASFLQHADKRDDTTVTVG